MMRHIDLRYGPEARNRLAEPATPTDEGAHAGLESFYYALNRRDNPRCAASGPTTHSRSSTTPAAESSVAATRRRARATPRNDCSAVSSARAIRSTPRARRLSRRRRPSRSRQTSSAAEARPRRNARTPSRGF
jgi:hypothetical protein